MALFAVECVDKPEAGGLRDRTRGAHLEYLRSLGAALRAAGPLLGPDDRPVGSLLFVEAEDQIAAEDLLHQDPYALAGLFQNVSVRMMALEIGGFVRS